MTYDHDWSDLSLANLRQRFAYQRLDKVKCIGLIKIYHVIQE